MGIRVGIDARSLGEKFTSNRTYWLELIRELIPIANDSGSELVLVSDSPIPAGTLPYLGGVREIVAPSRSSRLWSLFTFPKVCAREGVDVAHVQYTISPWMKCPTITTIHDVSFLIEPGWFSFKDRTLLRLSVPASAKRAAKVIAVSETSRQEIIERLPVEAEDVVATLLGVPSNCQRHSRESGREYAATELDVKGPYLLFVGGLQARKNWRGAIESVALARKEWPEIQLVITGAKRVNPAELQSTIEEFSASEWLHLVGGIPEAHLSLAYAGAEAVIHPSLHEGFGLTPLEAFACGVPVIASDRGAIPEVCGDAAQLLDPQDLESWAAAISRLKLDRERDGWIEKGLQRASAFSWKSTADKTWDVYRSAANPNK